MASIPQQPSASIYGADALEDTVMNEDGSINRFSRQAPPPPPPPAQSSWRTEWNSKKIAALAMLGLSMAAVFLI